MNANEYELKGGGVERGWDARGPAGQGHVTASGPDDGGKLGQR